MVTYQLIIGAVLIVAAIFLRLVRPKPTPIPTPKPYMKMDPPPDVDKSAHGHTGTDTCWLATAANMLAGAGYGIGSTVQARADNIYNQLVAHFGTSGGWTDTAVSWWLGSSHNTWTTNRYTNVTVYGNKSPKNPWNNSNGARFIANELRRCQFVGLSISWPIAGSTIGVGGHAITGWGDSSLPGSLTNNPTNVRVTDSDSDIGGNVQNYTYDTFTNPNPGGPNEGNGWYINYDNNHPYIKHIITLCPTDSPSDKQLTQKVVGSYKIHQNNKTKAEDLHYKVGTDTTILSYKTNINWEADKPPTIVEDSPRQGLIVDWEFKKKPIEYCTYITITTEFMLPTYNAIGYEDIHFTYPDAKPVHIPNVEWQMETPIQPEASQIRDVTGGYVVGSFEIQSEEETETKPLQYRSIHEYSYNQNPEQHVFKIKGTKGYKISNISFGHSYGYLLQEELWNFKDWMTKLDEEFNLSGRRRQIKIDWDGRLPYPAGEDITARIRDKREAMNEKDN